MQYLYLLNSAVITAPGRYVYRLVSPELAKAWASMGAAPPISTIGYAQTAAALSEILGWKVRVHRCTIKMAPGDEALVFRLVLPPGSQRIDPGDKGRLSKAIMAGHFELGILTRED